MWFIVAVVKECIFQFIQIGLFHLLSCFTLMAMSNIIGSFIISVNIILCFLLHLLVFRLTRFLILEIAPFVLKICGVLTRKFGSLLPSDDDPTPKSAQLYLCDQKIN
jgi:hypothetical protein